MDVRQLAGFYGDMRTSQFTAANMEHNIATAKNKFHLTYGSRDEWPGDEDLKAAYGIGELTEAYSNAKIEAESASFEPYLAGTLCGICKRLNLKEGFFPQARSGKDSEWVAEGKHVTVKHLKENREKCPLCGFLVDVISANDTLWKGYERAVDDDEVSWRFWQFAQIQDNVNQRSDLCRLQIESVADAREKTVAIYVKDLDVSWGLREIGLGRLVSTNSIEIDQICRWLSSCKRFHGDTCNGPSIKAAGREDKPFSLRMIDVEKGCVVEVPPDTKYVALSYCWGSPTIKHLKLLKETYDWMTTPGAFLQDLDKIPTTILDAIFLTRQIKEKYIWIDALCIIQDSKADVQAQIQIMDLIYQNAKVTIVATGESAWAGIEGIRPNTRSVRQLQRNCGDFSLITGIPNLEEKLLEATWETRAWTFQEKILSRRLLIFAGGQMFFCCNSDQWSEDVDLMPLSSDLKIQRTGGFEAFSKPDLSPVNPSPDKGLYRYPVHPMSEISEPWLSGRKEISLNDPRHQYDKLIGELTKRNLTVKEDILNAFQGVLNYLGPSFRGRFLYGISEDFLEGALLWHAEGQETVMADRCFPSWSWASSFRPVRMDYLSRYARLSGLKSVTTFFQIDAVSKKTRILSPEFEIGSDRDVHDSIDSLTRTPGINMKAREILEAQGIAFDRAICCITEVVELEVSRTNETRNISEMAEGFEDDKSRPGELVSNYGIRHNNGNWLGSVQASHFWRQAQPDKLKFILIACEVEGGYFDLPKILTMHLMLVDGVGGLYRRVNVPQRFFLLYEDWSLLTKSFELVVLV